MNKKIFISIFVVLLMTCGIAFAATPAPNAITYTDGNGYVEFSWTPGTGNVTDTYNYSKTIGGATTWYNSTTDTSVKWSGIGGESVTIYVYAFNTTYSELSTGVTSTVTVPQLFGDVVNLIDSIVPLFASILDLLIAIFPLVIAMVFLGGLAILISKIFDGTLDFSSFKKR